jgi:hypothetical protein
MQNHTIMIRHLLLIVKILMLQSCCQMLFVKETCRVLPFVLNQTESINILSKCISLKIKFLIGSIVPNTNSFHLRFTIKKSEIKKEKCLLV